MGKTLGIPGYENVVVHKSDIDMTNEEKANEIARDMLPYNNAEYHACYNSAMQAMQWKDEQEIEFLQSLMFQASTQQALSIIINNRIKLLKGE